MLFKRKTNILRELLVIDVLMQKSECIQQLRATFLKDNELKNNLSKLTTQARGNEKTECLSAVGGFSQIKPLLSPLDPKTKEEEHSSATNISPCQEKLISTFRKDFTQKKNLSKLTSQARGNEKQSCLQELGGYNQLSTFLINIEKNYTEQYEAKT